MMTRSKAAELARKVAPVVEQIRPLLAGLEPAVQSAVLADLLAMWLAGHIAPPKVREELLAQHVALVRDLIEPNERMIFELLGKGLAAP